MKNLGKKKLGPIFLKLVLANVPILYPLKTPENQRFSGFPVGLKWEYWPEMS